MVGRTKNYYSIKKSQLLFIIPTYTQKRCANDIIVYSKNVIFFYKLNFSIIFPFKKFAFPPFYKPSFLASLPFLLTFLYPSPYSPFLESPSPLVNGDGG